MAASDARVLLTLVHFLREATEAVFAFLAKRTDFERMTEAGVAASEVQRARSLALEAEERADIPYLAENVPLAFERCLASRERASLVVCGHSHVPFIGRDRGVTMFNPGSIGPRRFQLPITLGAIDVSRESAKLTHIDCETGKTWLPP